MPEIRPATPEDILLVAKEPMPKTGRAYAVTVNDEPLAVAGYYFDQGRVVLFSSIDRRARQRSSWYAKDVLRVARRVLAEAMALDMPLYAGADPDTPGAGELLEHLGFKQTERGIYQWAGR